MGLCSGKSTTIKMMMQLYQFPSCPYCRFVFAELKRLGLKEGVDFELVDARPGSQAAKDLATRYGKSQVPFLLDGEVKLYESMDIIHYLRQKYQQT